MKRPPERIGREMSVNQSVLRWLAVFDVVGIFLLVQLFIWRLQFTSQRAWVVFPIWLVLSFLVQRDTPRSLGWRVDNLWPATKQTLLPLLSFAIVLIAISLLLNAPNRLPPNLTSLPRLWRYFAFCLLQQVALQSFLNNRLISLLSNRWLSSLLAGAIFGISHWPNPVLVPVTFAGGSLMAWLFARYRNVIPLAVGQALIGSLVWAAFPPEWHHYLRVGPGYYRPL